MQKVGLEELKLNSAGGGTCVNKNKWKGVFFAVERIKQGTRLEI